MEMGGLNEIVILAHLEGHGSAITGIALPEGSSKLYTCSKDGTIRVWDCITGQCINLITLASHPGPFISNRSWLFCGAHNVVKAWNIQTNQEFSLDGTFGRVRALVFDRDMLFAGTDTGNILVWNAKASFEFVGSLSGHTASVLCLRIGLTKMYSGSIDGTIKVWDLETMQCDATLNEHSDAVTSLECWSSFLISCSSDCTIKVWARRTETENFDLEVVYTHCVDHGIVALFGMYDTENKPVLLCSFRDNSICLFDLPSFDERITFFVKQQVRALQVGVGGLFFTGDASGILSVWKWLTPAGKFRDDKTITLRKRGREGNDGCAWQPNKHFCARLMLT